MSRPVNAELHEQGQPVAARNDLCASAEVVPRRLIEVIAQQLAAINGDLVSDHRRSARRLLELAFESLEQRDRRQRRQHAAQPESVPSPIWPMVRNTVRPNMDGHVDRVGVRNFVPTFTR